MNLTPPAPLSEVLGAETRSLHRQAERTEAMGRLLRGELPANRYGTLLLNLRALYVRLETLLDRVGPTHPLLAWLNQPALRRGDALAEDLEVFTESGTTSDPPLLRATHAYLNALDGLASEWPLGLAAHAWVRYMGDLSGGQILARLIARHYALTEGRGVAFYTFPEIDDIEGFKAAFRGELDRIEPSDHGPIVREARDGFRRAIEMMDELAAEAA